jgi:hypothetical protein
MRWTGSRNGENAGVIRVKIERHRWADREAEVSGTERVNRTLSRSGRVDNITLTGRASFAGARSSSTSRKTSENMRQRNALDETAALEPGMQQKAVEFQHSGAEIYSKP